VTQRSDELRAIEIVEPGKEPRVEYHGNIRPTFNGNFLYFSCLVCGHDWSGSPDEDHPMFGGAPITFLHPVTEHDDDCDGSCIDRDCC
jgi:hypothetical protein